MPCWYYDKNELKQTPSIINDAIDYETECRYRQEGVRFIVNLGTSLNLIFNNTIATGVIYFHRFYMKHSFKQFPRYITACACLFLAGKVEETPKKCKDIIETSKILLTEQKFSLIFGRDPKDKIMTLEKILLQTIKFDLQVEHPYSYLLKYVKCLKGDKSKLQKKLQMAWNFVNDSLSTTLSLQWEPEIIAVAVMYLAGKLSKFEVVDWDGRQPNHLRWWDMFVEDVTMELLEDICHQVLDTYTLENNTLKEISQPTTPNSSSEPASSTPVSNDSTSTEPPEPRSNNYSEPQQGSTQPLQPAGAPAPLPSPSTGVQPNFTVYPPPTVYPAALPPVPATLPATTVPIQPSFTAYPPPPQVYQAPANMSVPPPLNPNMVPMHLPQPNYSVPPPAVPPPQYQYAYPTQIYYPPQNPPPNNRPYYPSL